MIVPDRSGNGYLDYRRSTVDRGRVIRSLLRSELPVRLIRGVLPHLSAAPDADAGAVCAEFLREVENFIPNTGGHLRHAT